jgi:hypothetical protein
MTMNFAELYAHYRHTPISFPEAANLYNAVGQGEDDWRRDGIGGWWINGRGQCIAVDPCGHEDYRRYHDVYEMGWVKIGLYDRDDFKNNRVTKGTAVVSFARDLVKPLAMRCAVKSLRLFEGWRSYSIDGNGADGWDRKWTYDTEDHKAAMRKLNVYAARLAERTTVGEKQLVAA